MYLLTALIAGTFSAGFYVTKGFSESIGYSLLGAFILICCLLAFFSSWDAAALQAEIRAEMERGKQ